MERAINILRKHGKLIGIAGGCDVQSINFWSKFDIDMLFSGGDWNFVYNAAQDALQKMKKIKGKEEK